VVEDNDSIAGSEVSYVRADCGHHAGGFMAEDAGGGVRAGSDFFEIGATDAASVDPEQEFSRTNFWDWNSFKPHVAYTAVDGGQHGGWDRMAAVVDRDLSGYPHRKLDES
jgi:hypothetical protein